MGYAVLLDVVKASTSISRPVSFHEAVRIGNAAGQPRILSPANPSRSLPSGYNQKLTAANHLRRRSFVSGEHAA
jgi:hypothetical protein